MRHTLNAFKKYLEQNGKNASHIFISTEICYLLGKERKQFAALIPNRETDKFVVAYKFQCMKKPTIEKTEHNMQDSLDIINQLFKI